jgi:hypothetical protein
VKLHVYRWLNSIIDHSSCEYARENEKNKAKAILKPLPWVVPAHYPGRGQRAEGRGQRAEGVNSALRDLGIVILDSKTVD